MTPPTPDHVARLRAALAEFQAGQMYRHGFAMYVNPDDLAALLAERDALAAATEAARRLNRRAYHHLLRRGAPGLGELTYLSLLDDLAAYHEAPVVTHGPCQDPTHDMPGLPCDHCVCGMVWPHEDERPVEDPT